MCKVLAHIAIKGNEEADKAAKQIIVKPGMTTSRYLIHTTTWLEGGIESSNDKGSVENSTSKLHYIKSCIEKLEFGHNSCRLFEVKLSRLLIGYTRLTHGHLIKKNQQPICSMWKPNTNN